MSNLYPSLQTFIHFNLDSLSRNLSSTIVPRLSNFAFSSTIQRAFVGDSPHDRIIATHCPINSIRNLCYCLGIKNHISKCLNIIILFMSLPSSSLLQNLSFGQSLSAVHPVIHFSISVFVFGQTYLKFYKTKS